LAQVKVEGCRCIRVYCKAFKTPSCAKRPPAKGYEKTPSEIVRKAIFSEKVLD